MQNQADYYAALYRAVRDSFDPTSLKHLLSSRFDMALTDVTSESDPFPEQVREVVGAFRQRGELDRLLAALAQERPAVKEFAMLHEQYAASLSSTPQLDYAYTRADRAAQGDLLDAVGRLERTVDELCENVRKAERGVAELQSEVYGNERGAHRGLVHGVETLRTLTAELRTDLADYMVRYETMRAVAVAAVVLALLSIVGLFLVVGWGAVG